MKVIYTSIIFSLIITNLATYFVGYNNGKLDGLVFCKMVINSHLDK